MLIETEKVRLKVDVQPFSTSVAGYVSGPSNQFAANACTLMRTSDCRVENERVLVSIPGDVHEADQVFAIPTSEMAEASAQDVPERTRLVAVPCVGE